MRGLDEQSKQLWGRHDLGSDVVRVAVNRTVHRLRRKLEDDPTRPVLLLDISGVGVLLAANQADWNGTFEAQDVLDVLLAVAQPVGWSHRRIAISRSIALR